MKKKKMALKYLKMIAQSLESTLKEKVDKIIGLVENCEKLLDENINGFEVIRNKCSKILSEIDEETILIEKRVKTFAPDFAYKPEDLDMQVQEWAGLTINHEINNPLSIIKGRVQSIQLMLQKEKTDAKYIISRLSKIKNETERISIFISKLLNASDISIIEYQGHEMMIDFSKL
jgi:nitrogen-specific signal transduction histidine kinase